MKTKLILTLLMLIMSKAILAQTGEIKGNVFSTNPNIGVPFASIGLYLDTSLVLISITDFEGNFLIKNVNPGRYILKVTSVGFQPGIKKDVLVKSKESTAINVELINGVQLQAVEVIDKVIPLIDAGSPAQQKTLTYEQVQSISTKDANSAAVHVTGAYRNKKVDEINIRGSRSDCTSYYIDGVKIAGEKNRFIEENNEEYEKIYENSFLDVHNNALSTFSIDVDAASYSNIRRFINQGNLPHKDAVRIEEMISYFNYNYPEPEGDDPFSITMEAHTCPWNPEHKLVRIGLNGKKIETENLPDNNLVFLIDVSGSMKSEDKLSLLKRSFRLLVEQLRRQDRVAIVVYAGSAGMVLPSTSGNDKERILHALSGLEAGGSTAGGAGLHLAYKIAKQNFIHSGNNRVILATDGDFNVGVSSDGDLVSLIEEKRDEGIFLTVLGFGTGNIKDSKMEKLADKGNGNYSYVDNIMEANKVFVKEMGATLVTIAKDVKLQIEFNPKNVKAYRLIGYENRLLADEDFNDDKKDAGELGSGKTVTALYEIIPAGSNEVVNSVDPLKYQNILIKEGDNNELLTIKFRYKNPDGTKSKLIQRVLENNNEQSIPGTDFVFASSVAEFGMILRNSKFKGSADFKSVLRRVRQSKGHDENGYRSEFIRLVESAELISKSEKATSRK